MTETRVTPRGPISTVIRQVQVVAERRRPRLAPGTLTLQTPSGVSVRARRRPATEEAAPLDIVPRWG